MEVFPRGKTSASTSTGAKRELNQDALFGSNKRAKFVEVVEKKKKGDKKKSDPLPSIGLAVNAAQKKVKIEALNGAKYASGCAALGIVLSVHEDQVLLSLPGGLLGTIQYHEVSDVIHKLVQDREAGLTKQDLPKLTALVKVHQVLRCSVLTKDGDEKKIPLTARTSIINRGLALKHLYEGMTLSACVVSKEDHGYIVNGGVNGVNFFLPVKEAEKYSSNLTIGEPLECSIREINLGARTVTLRVNRNGHKEEVVKSSQIPFIALAPGMLFDVIVNKKVDNGYIVNYLNLFNGMVDLNSMAIPSSTQEWKDAKEPTSAIKARIVFIDYNNKIVRLSLKRHILEFRSPAGLPELGAVVENLVVVSSNKRSGAISRIQVDQESIDEMKQLQSEISEIDSTTDNKEKTKTLNELKGKLQNTLTFQLTKKSLAASIDQSNEEEVDAIDENKIASVYETGTTIPSVKVLGYHLLENIVIASNLKSVLDSTVSHHKDIKVGQSHTVEITAVRDFGLVCSISNKISAVCPTSHTGDVVIDTKLKKRFKVGQKLKMRVWEASADGAIILTNKKSLVELPDQSVLSSYETSQVDGHYVGVIGKITTNGLTVRFFNNIHGDVPAVILSQQGVLDLEESYRAGQIIKLVLLKVESKSQGKNGKQFKKLIFALDLNITESVRKQLTALLENKTEGDGNKSGSIIGGAVMKVEDNELIVRLDDGKLAKLPKAHVFDSASTAEAVFASKDHPFKAGYRIEKALILSGNDKEVFITTKPLLLFAAQQRAEDISIPSGVSGLSPGQMLAGYIAKVENYGVVVRFRNGFTALAPRPSLADKFVNTPIGLFNVGDAIRCVVQRVDLGKERAIVTFKPSMIPPLPSGHHFINSYWQELFLTSSHKAAADKKLFPNWKEYKIGQVYQAKLSSVESYGAVFLADDQTTIFVDRAFTGKLKAGESTKLLILDLDIVNCVFEVKVVDKSLQKSLKSQNNIANGETVDVVIETIKDKYLVVSKGVFIGFVPLADYNNLTPEVVDYKVGATLKVQSLGQQSQTGNEYPHGLVNICVVPQDTTAVRSRLVKLQKEAADSDEKLHKRLAGDNESTADATVVRQKFIESLRVGAAMKWTVESKTATELKLLPEFNELMGLKVQAFVHISACSNDFIANDNLKEVLSSSNIKKKDRERVHASHPFHNIKDKQSVWCHVLQVRRETDDKDNEVFIVYLRLSDKKQNNDTATSAKFHPMLQAHGKDELKVATVAPVYVTRINQATCTVALSPYITAELPIIEISKDRALIDLFHQKCFCGLRLLVAVTAVTKEDGKTTKVHVSRASIESLIEAHGTEEIDDIQDKVNEIESEVNYEEGDIVVGTVNLFQSKVPKPPAFVVSLRGNKFGRLCVSEITERENWRDSSAALQSDDATRTLFNGLAHGSIVTCRIVSTKDKMIELSLRKSRVETKKLKDALKSDPLPTEGQVIPAFVTAVSEKGCFVRISRTTAGRVLLKDLDDGFVENPKEAFPVGKLVEGKVMSVDHIKGMVQLSLKPSVVIGDTKAKKEIERIKEDDVVKGTVERVNEIGVFVRINGTSLVGLARKATALQDSSKALQEEYQVGDVVRAKVLRVSASTLKIALGLRESYFRNETLDEEEESGSDEEEEVEDSDDEDVIQLGGDDDEDDEEEDSEDDEEQEEDGEEVEEDDDDEEDGDEEDDDDDVADYDEDDIGKEVEEQVVKEVKSVSKAEKGKKRKTIDADDSDDEVAALLKPKTKAAKVEDDIGEFDWDGSLSKNKLEGKSSFASATNSDSEEEDDEEDDGAGNGKSKGVRSRQKEAERKRKEEELRSRERALAEGRLVPESSDDFERLLIAEPNSSFLWIQYMAFHLNSADVDSARVIANRALRTIHFREEDEKFNVWMALLNLEYKYGTKDTLEKVFAQSVSESKCKQIYLSLANTFEQAGDKEGATSLFERALKKPQFKKSKKVWIAYQAFKLRCNEIKASKELLNRSLQSLSRHKHIEVISKYALAEFEHGSSDRARVLFEELLNNYPKRTDLWHLYVDKETKLGNYNQARQLFERMIASKSSTRNMKAIFKKFLTFESQHGNEESQELVKQKARDYVASLA